VAVRFSEDARLADAPLVVVVGREPVVVRGELAIGLLLCVVVVVVVRDAVECDAAELAAP
jgi:hypothetical protein